MGSVCCSLGSLALGEERGLGDERLGSSEVRRAGSEAGPGRVGAAGGGPERGASPASIALSDGGLGASGLTLFEGVVSTGEAGESNDSVGETSGELAVGDPFLRENQSTTPISAAMAIQIQRAGSGLDATRPGLPCSHSSEIVTAGRGAVSSTRPPPTCGVILARAPLEAAGFVPPCRLSAASQRRRADWNRCAGSRARARRKN